MIYNEILLKNMNTKANWQVICTVWWYLNELQYIETCYTILSDICMYNDIFILEFRKIMNYKLRLVISSDGQKRERELGASKWCPKVQNSVGTFYFLNWLVETGSSLHRHSYNFKYTWPLNNTGISNMDLA